MPHSPELAVFTDTRSLDAEQGSQLMFNLTEPGSSVLDTVPALSHPDVLLAWEARLPGRSSSVGYAALQVAPNAQQGNAITGVWEKDGQGSPEEATLWRAGLIAVVGYAGLVRLKLEELTMDVAPEDKLTGDLLRRAGWQQETPSSPFTRPHSGEGPDDVLMAQYGANDADMLGHGMPILWQQGLYRAEVDNFVIKSLARAWQDVVI